MQQIGAAWPACNNARVIWLGEKRGNLSDWTTQQWVRATGRRLLLADHPWLAGPTGETRHIGKSFYERYAEKAKLKSVESGVRGLIPSFKMLAAERQDLADVALPVREFYERTSEFDLDAWSEWHLLFKPFGKALSAIFSQRLQQLNVPLSSLDSAKGMTSKVIQMVDPDSGDVVQTAWVRNLHATDNVLYAGSYSVCRVPGHAHPCVKVVFPLPNGNAIVLMKAEGHTDGSLVLRSTGAGFGEPGFYFVVHEGDGVIRARYVASMKEEIHVYPAEESTVRADHILRIWGRRFLRIHYRMRKVSREAIEPVEQTAGRSALS
jgi:hypothetical protein